MSFLPDDFDMPRESTYFRYEPGDNLIRITSDTSRGFEYWNVDGKPVRSKDKPVSPPDIRMKDGLPEPIKTIWLMTVYDMKNQVSQVLQIHQVTFQRFLFEHFKDDAWGHPAGYTVKVKKDPAKSGAGIYTYSTLPHTALSAEQLEGVFRNSFDLEMLFQSGDPKQGYLPDKKLDKAKIVLLDAFMKEHSSAKEYKELLGNLQQTKAPQKHDTTNAMAIQLIGAVGQAAIETPFEEELEPVAG